MMAKIEWYQEILEQDPGSRAFFPLARLLVASGRQDEAIAVLRRGLEQHPDFFEARLQIVSLVYARDGNCQACESELAEVTRLFRAYPLLWSAWAGCESGGDMALALRFMALAVASGADQTFRDIFERGLARAEAESEGQAATMPPLQASGSPRYRFSASSRAEKLPMRPVENLSSTERRPAPRGGESAEASSSEADETAPADGVEEKVNLRTRSMAEVLAEQGDLAGALAIYQELEEAARTPEEAASLRERAEQIRAAQSSGTPLASDKAAESAPGQGAPAEAGNEESPKMMLNLLENLAGRLEARARE